MVRSPIQHTELSLQASPDPITRPDPPSPPPELPGSEWKANRLPNPSRRGFGGEEAKIGPISGNPPN